ncbi:MAG: hypothetical protein QM495_01515 [Lutibacter sp.]|uniref:hypothetical protein n=1 Tax=Lutibacter sp. TaxID=1925666 RepID=UPI003859AA78
MFKNQTKLATILMFFALNINAQEKVFISENDSLELYETYISINSIKNIFPTIYNNGLIYSSSNKASFYHLFYSDLKSKSKKIKIPKKFQTGAVTTFKNEIYVTSASSYVDSFGVFNLAIYKGVIENLKVTNLKILPVCTTYFSYEDPAIAKDGNTMVIVTNENGRYHLLELKRNSKNEWKRGAVIYISHPDFKLINPTIYNKNTIYFSSNMYNGKLNGFTYENVEGVLKLVEKNREKGVFNIYKTQKKEGKWQLPEKVNVLNSEFDELGVVFDTDKSGYLTTFRFSDTDNIYYFKLKQ